MEKTVNNFKVALFLSVGLVLLTGCAAKSSEGSSSTKLVNAQVYDRSGGSEMISTPEKLKRIAKLDLLKPQPYQKVIQVYERDAKGKSSGVVVTYHENGLPWQYLETAGGRAHGKYKEWFSSGNIRMEAIVIEGKADVSEEAQISWIFDGSSKVWDNLGNILAEIKYSKGDLTDQSIYYYPDGSIAKIIPYVADKIHGRIVQYSPEGEEIGFTEYVDGVKDGEVIFKGTKLLPERQESYSKGLLLQGKYWDLAGKCIREITSGNGYKPVYSEGLLTAEYEYRNGRAEGEVRMYLPNGQLINVSTEIEGLKEGEEWCYFEELDKNGDLRPKLYLNWKEDQIHGIVRSWYPNGNLESEREMAQNKKHGIFLSWYEEGSLMLVEHYENDVLKDGKYLKKGDDVPISRVIEGSGVATIYDSQGCFVRKIEYRKGQPIE